MDPEKKSLNFIQQPTRHRSTPPAPAVSGGSTDVTVLVTHFKERWSET